MRAAVSAGMNVVALATSFTIAGLHSSRVLDHAWIVRIPPVWPALCERGSLSTTGTAIHRGRSGWTSEVSGTQSGAVYGRNISGGSKWNWV